MLLINIFRKKLIQKVKNTKGFTPILDILFSDRHVIKYSCKSLSVYINIILTLFLIHNLLILCPHKKSIQLSIYSDEKFFFSSKHFNSMWIIQIPVFTLHLYDCQEIKSNRPIQIEVLLRTQNFKQKSIEFILNIDIELRYWIQA